MGPRRFQQEIANEDELVQEENDCVGELQTEQAGGELSSKVLV